MPCLNIDFFTVEMPEDSPPFDSVLVKVGALDHQSRNFDVGSTPVRLQHYSRSGNLIHGDLVRIRMDELPAKASLSGDVGPLNLESDEGLGEETAFLYDSRLNALLLQRNRVGVTASVFVKYFEGMAELSDPINLLPTMRSDAMKRLDELATVRKLKLKVSGTENLRAFKKAEYGLSTLADLSSALSAPTVSIEVGMSYARGSMHVRAVKNAVKKALKLTDVEALTLDGYNALEDKEVIDFIKDRMSDSVSIPPSQVDGRSRSVSYYVRNAVLKEAWERAHDELGELLRRA